MCCFCLNNQAEQRLRHAATTVHPYLIVKALMDLPSVTSTACAAKGPKRTRHIETNKSDEVFVDERDRWLLCLRLMTRLENYLYFCPCDRITAGWQRVSVFGPRRRPPLPLAAAG